jgi:hypothetical protein
MEAEALGIDSWSRPRYRMGTVARPVTSAGYEYPSTNVKLRYWGSTHEVDLGTGWVRLLVTRTIAGYEYLSAEVKTLRGTSIGVD